MAIDPVHSGSSTSGGSRTDSTSEALRGLNLDDFFKLMIAELQNQDPLNPLENSEMLQQISQIREVGATDKLTDTLDAVLLGQNLSNATGFVGKNIKGLTDEGTKVEGVVNRVTVSGGQVVLHVGDAQLGMNNVSEILTDKTVTEERKTMTDA